jgi:hypothetical protein
LLLAAHLCHSGVLWAEEDLPLAAGLRMLHGAALYRDVWFDKPPLVPAIYLLWGARIGAVLRVAGAIYALLACLLGYALASQMWSRREGYWAAGLIAFFLTFDTHSAVLPLAADLLLLVPHLAAVWLAARRQYFLAGVAAGIGFLFNAKGVLVLAACAVFAWPDWAAGAIPLVAGFAAPNVAALGWLAGTGSLGPYIDQVWRWPAQYTGSPVVADPVWNGVVRTLNWLGFHAALVIGAVAFWLRARSGGDAKPGSDRAGIADHDGAARAVRSAISESRELERSGARSRQPCCLAHCGRLGSGRRLAVRLGIPAGRLRVYGAASGDAVSGFAGDDGGAGGPPSDAVDRGVDSGDA